MSTRQKFMAIFFVSVSLLLSAGCSKSNKEEGLAILWWGDIYNRSFGQRLVAAYNQTNPRIPARLLTVEGDYNSKVLTMAASNTLPDIVLLTSDQVLNLGSRGVLLRLDVYEKGPEFSKIKGELWPGLLEAVRLNDKLMAAPIWTWTPGFYYNKDLFDAAGVSYPSENWTWEEFKEKAIKLTKKESGKTVVYGVAHLGYRLSDPVLINYLYSYGGKLISDDRKKCELDSPKSIAAMKELFDLRLKYGVAPSAFSGESAILRGMRPDVFIPGKAAMFSQGRDYLDVLRKKGGAKFRWGVVAMPRGPRKINFVSSVYVGVSAHARTPEAAFKFLSFIIGEEGQKLITGERSDITVIKKLAYQKDFLDF